MKEPHEARPHRPEEGSRIDRRVIDEECDTLTALKTGCGECIAPPCGFRNQVCIGQRSGRSRDSNLPGFALQIVPQNIGAVAMRGLVEADLGGTRDMGSDRIGNHRGLPAALRLVTGGEFRRHATQALHVDAARPGDVVEGEVDPAGPSCWRSSRTMWRRCSPHRRSSWRSAGVRPDRRQAPRPHRHGPPGLERAQSNLPWQGAFPSRWKSARCGRHHREGHGGPKPTCRTKDAGIAATSTCW